MKTKVKIRELNKFVEVNITSEDKPQISKHVIEKWQRIIDLIAAVFDVPAGLIMKITKEDMEVFLKSSNKENPYPAQGKDRLGHGLYCETVLGTSQPLFIDNALKYHDWENNPDVKINMISYYGLPIKWPDDSFFGTICVLDRREMKHNEKHKALIEQMKDSMETDLDMLMLQSELYKTSIADALTGVYNRRYLSDTLQQWIYELKDQSTFFSVVMLDIDHFKQVNDQFGHLAGDQVLIRLSTLIQTLLDKEDFIARFGGDEFVVCLKNKDRQVSELLISNLIQKVKTDEQLKPYQIQLSYGVACIREKEINIEKIITLIDDEMYRIKHQLKH